ncbi:MAG: hypothetical protein ACT4ON_13755 [Bacteroidota bacterium]
MSSFKEKSQLFIMGMMAGLIIAGGFFILKLDDYFKELNFYKSVAQTFSSDSKNNEVAVKISDVENTEEKKVFENKTKSKKTESEAIPDKKEFMLSADTLNTQAATDSVTKDINDPNDIIVRKDELLFTKTIEVINLNPVASTVNTKDSLLQKVSGITDDRTNSKQFFNIEFWQSPLNYKGYKMSKYKLVLYGITSAEGIKIYKSDDIIYLKNQGGAYKLDQAGDFRPYERVTDETIISKLK